MYGGGNPQESKGGDDAALMAALAMAAAQEQSKKKNAYAEAALPVALLIILALIFAVKLGFINLGGISLFSKPTTVLILTDDPTSQEIQATLQVLHKDASYYQIKTRTMTLTPNKRIYAKSLADADVIMLYEVDNKVLSVEQRKELAKYLKAGGKLLVVKDSGTYVPQCDVLGTNCDPQAREWVGWMFLSDYMPVECDDEASCQPQSVSDAVIESIDTDNPIVKPFADRPINIGTTDAIVQLQPSDNGVDVADIYVGGVDNPQAVFPAITVSEGMFGTKVIHFNFDPWQSKALLINAILYLAGRAS